MIPHARVVRTSPSCSPSPRYSTSAEGRAVNHRACAQANRSCAHGNAPRAEAPTYNKRLPQPNASLRPSGGTVQVFGGCDLAVSLIRSQKSSRTLQKLNRNEKSPCRIITTPQRGRTLDRCLRCTLKAPYHTVSLTSSESCARKLVFEMSCGGKKLGLLNKAQDGQSITQTYRQ